MKFTRHGTDLNTDMYIDTRFSANVLRIIFVQLDTQKFSVLRLALAAL